MHGYHWDRKRLEGTLNEFAGGQFQMETKEHLLFRGEIADSIAPSSEIRRVLVSFVWLAERRFIFDENWTLRPKWFLLQQPAGLKSPYLSVEFSYYYSQQDEDRVKMRGTLGEVCHFYKKEDHTNLVCNGDEIVQYWELHKLGFFQAIMIVLKK